MSGCRRPGLVAHHVGGLFGQGNHQPVQLVRHLDLAAQAGGGGQAESKIEHVFFVLADLAGSVEPRRVDDDMARRARHRAFASAFNVYVVTVGNFHHGQALRRVNFVARAIGFDKGHFWHVFRGTHLSASLILRLAIGSGRNACAPAV